MIVLNSNIKELLSKLSQMPKDTTRAFEKKIYNIKSEIEDVENYINEIKKNYDSIINDSSISLKTRYNFFFLICTIYRKEKSYAKYEYILNEYKSIFQRFESFKHLEVLIKLEKIDSKVKVDETLSLIDDLLNVSPENPGYLHNYSFCVANAFYESIFNKNDNREELKEAIANVKKAIRLDKNHAKFYATLGRLQILDEKFNKGRSSINDAIKLESSQGKNYSIIISEYQSYLAIGKIYEFMVDNNHTYKEFKIELDETKKELRNINTKNLEFLGFFTALISFTIGSISIADGQSFHEAARLILTLCGGLLIVFSGFGFIIGNSEKLKSQILVGLMGLLVIYFSLNGALI